MNNTFDPKNCRYSSRHVVENATEKHQLKILIDTVKNPSKWLLGGPDANEAKRILKEKFHYTDKQIADLEKMTNDASKAENSRKTKREIQKMSIAEILQAIRTKSLTYAEVDDALEEIKEFSKLDRIGDALAKDDLKGK